MPDNDDLDQQPTGNTVTMTKDELDKLLSDARSRAYTKADKAAQQAEALKAEVDRLAKVEADRSKTEEQARKAAETARKQAEEAEMSAKQLIDQRSAELQAKYDEQANKWATQIQGLQSQMAEREALFEKERAFQALASYTAEQVNAHSSEIAPELVRYIGKGCNTQEEIDASIAEAIETTTAIVAGIQNAQTQAMSQMPGVSSGGFTPTGPMDTQGGRRTFSSEEIKAMDLSEFGNHREAFGVTGSNVGTGRFGHLGKGLLG